MASDTHPATSAKWYAHSSTASRDVLLRLDGGLLIITANGRELIFRRERLRVTSRISGIPAVVTLDNGSWLQIPDGELARALSGKRGNMLAWMESRLLRLLPLLLALLVGLYLLMNRVVLPRAGDWVASQIPVRTVVAWEDRFWEGTAQVYFETLGHDPGYADEKSKLNRLGALMSAAAGGKFPLSFILIEGDPNAMALPGGRIMVTPKLMKLLTDEEIAAVLGHEIGHIERRHALKGLGRSVLWSLFTLATGNVDVVNFSAVLTELAYSRAAERDADCFSRWLLDKAGMEPEAMRTALAALYEHYDNATDEPAETYDEPDAGTNEKTQPLSGLAEVIKTHPDLDSRTRSLLNCYPGV